MTAPKAPPMFSVRPFQEPEHLPLPTAGPYYLATSEGYMAYMNFHFGRVLVPVPNAPSLPTPEHKGYLFYHIDPKVPSQLIAQAWSFFRAIWEKNKAEAMVDITWSPTKGYRLFVPKQETTMGGVTAKRKADHYKGQQVGTIHSHCNFNAFHSGTDTHDADEHDGLHITLGHVDRESGPSVAVMVAHSKIKWDINPEDAFDMPAAPQTHPEWWEGFVSKPSTTPTPSTGVTVWKAASTAPRIKAPPSNINRKLNSDDAGYAYLSISEVVWDQIGRISDKTIDELSEIEVNLDLIQTELEKHNLVLDYTLERVAPNQPPAGRYKTLSDAEWEDYMRLHADD